ncbi:hypothetical protein ACLOJK_038025 [Asimina triloba]
MESREASVQGESENERAPLHEDVLLQILSWLPKKYSYRFKCLSMRWNALISALPRVPHRPTPSGFLLQTPLLPTRLRATFFRIDADDPVPVPDNSLTFVFDGNSLFAHPYSPDDQTPVVARPRRDFSIAASSNGLLLLRTLVLRETCFHVYDPISNHSQSLPPHPSALATNIVAFAVDGSHYKVVCLADWPHPHHAGGFVLVFHIFSSLTRKWRERAVRSPSSKPPEPRTVLVGENLYWVGGDYLLVFRFRDDRHVFVELPDPDKQFIFPRNGCIWEADGRVQYCDCIFNRIRIWALRSEGYHTPPGSIWPRFGWQLKHDVVPRFADSPSLYVCDFKKDFFPCGFNDDYGIVFLWYKGEEGVLVSCNLATGVMKKISRCRPATPHAFIPFFYGASNSLFQKEKKKWCGG